MWEQDSQIEPTVYQLRQQSGPVAVQSLRRSERDWPLTLDDCQGALAQLLKQLPAEQSKRSDYWRWVGLTRGEMLRLYRVQQEQCRRSRQWDLGALLRLRWRLEVVSLRLYCAPWMPGEASHHVLGLHNFTRLTA